MKQYKIVKREGYDTIYDVYQKVIWFWRKIGYCSCSKLEEKYIVEAARKLVSPNTLYFSE